MGIVMFHVWLVVWLWRERERRDKDILQLNKYSKIIWCSSSIIADITSSSLISRWKMEIMFYGIAVHLMNSYGGFMLIMTAGKVLVVVSTMLQRNLPSSLPSFVYVSLSKERHTREYSSMFFRTCVWNLVWSILSEKSAHDIPVIGNTIELEHAFRCY